MRFTECRKRDVVATSTAETVGRVDLFVVEPEGARVGSVRLDKVSGDARFLSWSDVASFGQDVVTIEDEEVLRPADGPREEGVRKDAQVLGKLVLSDAGRELGTVSDVEFDPADGRVTSIITEREQIAGSRLRGVGTYAVVVARS